MGTIRKVGNSITIKSLKWYEENKEKDGSVLSPDNSGTYFNSLMKDFCEKTFIISEVRKNPFSQDLYYLLEGGEMYWGWCEWMIEGEIENGDNLPLVEDLLKSLCIEDYTEITHMKAFDPNKWIQSTTTKEFSLWWNVEGHRVLVIRKIGIFKII